MKTVDLKTITEKELASTDEETRQVTEMLNSLESILEISEQFKKWGNQEQSDVLMKAVETMSNLLFGEVEDITEEEAEVEIKSSIEKIEAVATLLKECGNIEHSNLIDNAITKLSMLIFGLDFYKEWDKAFEMCYKIAVEKGDTELANEIKQYIGITKESTLDEDFSPLLKRCIDIVHNY